MFLHRYHVKLQYQVDQAEIYYKNQTDNALETSTPGLKDNNNNNNYSNISSPSGNSLTASGLVNLHKSRGSDDSTHTHGGMSQDHTSGEGLVPEAGRLLYSYRMEAEEGDIQLG